MTPDKQPEPWLRGTLSDVHPVARAVLHALQLAEEDLLQWCGQLSVSQLNFRGGLASVAFQIRHIARSIDRLLTYAEGRQLDNTQMQALKGENANAASRDQLFRELHQEIERAVARIRALADANLAQPRVVGRKNLPTTLAGLLIHVADHTQRHVGQAIVTAKIVCSATQPHDQ